ncbi:MAG: hypothetical protein H6628_10795 [Calditrichae bacterium]|nr:hypothetical protein [Calditrichia bacterium]
MLQISERPFYADSVLFSGTGLFNLVDLVTLNVIGGGLVVDSFATLQLNTANLGSDGFLQGDGPLTVNGTFDWTLGTIQGAGDLLINGTLVTGTGGTRVLDGRTLTINGQAHQTETIRLGGSAVLLNQAGARYELGGDVNIEISGGGSFSNAGTFAKITTAGISRVEADFENDGIVDVQSGTLGFDGAFTNQAGALVQGSGTLDLSGAGFSNDGIFSPGASPGILSVSGNYYQSAAAQLQVEVAGDSAGTAYDRLQVSGNATLDGDLTVSLDGGIFPFSGSNSPSLPERTAAARLPVCSCRSMTATIFSR